MQKNNKPFLIKRLTVDSFDKNGNGILEETLRLKAPYVVKSESGSLNDYCQSLRKLFMLLMQNEDPKKRIELPVGTRMVHLKTNTHKNISISCMVIYTKDITDDRINTRTDEPEDEFDWDHGPSI
jgi:hypothetical protein